jgi:integrase
VTASTRQRIGFMRWSHQSSTSQLIVSYWRRTPPHVYAKEAGNRRDVARSQIRLFWDGIIEPPVPRLVGLALRLALLTGVRVGEAAEARKSEFEGATWLIPASRTKNKRDHLIPLSPLALEVISEASKLADDADSLFPALRNRKKSVARQALPMAMQEFSARQSGSWKADPPVPHDLRRTPQYSAGPDGRC